MTWTIQRKLYTMIAVLAVLLAGPGAVTYERFERNAAIEDEVVAAHHAELAAAEIRRGILEARRREKDFFVRQGDQKYRDQVKKEVDGVLKTAQTLRQAAVGRAHLDDAG